MPRRLGVCTPSRSSACRWRSTTSEPVSSFAYLQDFPIDSLKIDRSFTNAITQSAESQALVRMLVQLSRDLGMKTVAEGVETLEEMDQLRLEHVDEAQGYLLARPLQPQQFRDTVLRPRAIH